MITFKDIPNVLLYLFLGLPLIIKLLFIFGFIYGIYVFIKKGIRFLSSAKEELKKLEE